MTWRRGTVLAFIYDGAAPIATSQAERNGRIVEDEPLDGGGLRTVCNHGQHALTGLQRVVRGNPLAPVLAAEDSRRSRA